MNSLTKIISLVMILTLIFTFALFPASSESKDYTYEGGYKVVVPDTIYECNDLPGTYAFQFTPTKTSVYEFKVSDMETFYRVTDNPDLRIYMNDGAKQLDPMIETETGYSLYELEAGIPYIIAIYTYKDTTFCFTDYNVKIENGTLAYPLNVTAEQNDDYSVDVTWTPSESATEYLVFSLIPDYTQVEYEWTYLGKTSDAKFNVAEVKSFSTYYFAVQAKNETQETDRVLSNPLLTKYREDPTETEPSVLEYETEDGTLSVIREDDSFTITGFAPNKENVIIPSAVDDTIIKTVGEGAFEGSEITNLTLPDSLTDIGKCAFINSKIKTIRLHKATTQIDNDAFKDCDPDLLIYVFKDSAAHDFVKTKDLPFRILGDVDMDSYVSISDVTCIQQFLAKIRPEEDFDLIACSTRTYKVTIAEASAIQQYLSKIIDSI